MSAFIIDTDAPGCVREDLLAKVGMPTANTGMFELSDCQVPLNNLLAWKGRLPHCHGDACERPTSAWPPAV